MPLLPWLLWLNVSKRLICPASTSASVAARSFALYLDNENRVALAVPPSAQVNIDIVDRVVTLEDGCSTRTLPLDWHNLWCTPIKLVLGEYLLLLHLLRDVIVGDGRVA